MNPSLLSRRSHLAGMAATAAAALCPTGATAAVQNPLPPNPKGNAATLTHLAYTDLAGRPDSVQIMSNGHYLYVGHMFSGGFTVVDVSDPRDPKPVNFIPTSHNTRSHHLQFADNLLLAVNALDPTVALRDAGAQAAYYQSSLADSIKTEHKFDSGLRIFDVSKPAEPREISFLNIPGLGLNRLWYVGGRYAYISAHFDGWTDDSLAIVDLADITKPKVVGRYWLPGMWRAGGETPGWPANRRVALHHMIVAGTLGYAAWRDGGFTIIDVADPTNPRLISHTNTAPPYAGGTHTPLPLPGRNLAIVADEANSFACAKGLSYNWIMDVRAPTNPVSIATFPTPAEQPFCRPGEIFGPHNLHENRPGTFQSETTIFATYHNAGLRVFDITNQYEPKQIAAYVPPPPTRIIDPRPGNALAPQTCDILVRTDGVAFLSDWNAGLHVLQYEG